MKPVRLSFFNEQPSPALTALLERPRLMEQLTTLGASVTMGLVDLTDERASAVKRLSDEGITVDAWLLLERTHGYFATADNTEHVEARVDAFRRWKDRHRLPITSLGFDFEPALGELDVFFERPVRALAHWWKRARNRSRHEVARARYTRLVESLRADGFSLESYQFPLLVEDRASASQFFQRFISSVDVPVEREVLMVYSSLLGALGPGLTEAWTREAKCVAVGSTGGGIDPLPKLSFDELARDLRWAARTAPDVRIFSLEGCAERDFLPRLIDFDWSTHASLSMTQRTGAAFARRAARVVARLMA